jgi:hypothetical protein
MVELLVYSPNFQNFQSINFLKIRSQFEKNKMGYQNWESIIKLKNQNKMKKEKKKKKKSTLKKSAASWTLKVPFL